MTKPDLAAQATQLRAAHFDGAPLILPNVWDAASAQAVVAAGHRVLATSSSAIAASLGAGDHEQMSAAVAFAAAGRIAAAVSVPVSADLEAGYQLPPAEFVDRMLAAGVVGCNLEDSQHHGDAAAGSGLRDADEQADYIAAVCAAGQAAGVPIVVNARTDVFVRATLPTEQRLDEALRRGRKYLAAGATCIYPIGLVDPANIAAMVAQLAAPINIWLLGPGRGPSLVELRELGVARVSLAGALHRRLMGELTGFAAALLARDRDSWLGAAN